jgi:Pyridine nucleotide-disulphide oxidoreductase, dimerisation domain
MTSLSISSIRSISSKVIFNAGINRSKSGRGEFSSSPCGSRLRAISTVLPPIGEPRFKARRSPSLLAETVLAMEMGADLEDLALTIHAHPTLSETPMFAAEMGLGSIADLYIPKK